MIVLCSGGFDAIHSGHLRYLEGAAELGEVVVAVNSDEWLLRKKGYLVYEWKERAAIVSALKPVSRVVEVDDSDDTVCSALMEVLPDIFANGGDRTVANQSEHEICEDLGIKEVFDVGGEKINSSSKLIETLMRQYNDHHKDSIQN